MSSIQTPAATAQSTTLTRQSARGFEIVSRPAIPQTPSDHFVPADLATAPRAEPSLLNRVRENVVNIPFKHTILGAAHGARKKLGYGTPAQVAGLEPYYTKVPGPFGERVRVNLRGPMVTALGHSDDPGDALNTVSAYRALPKRIDGKQMMPHVLMRAARSPIEKAVYKVLPVDDFFTFVYTARTTTGNETAEQKKASADRNKARLRKNAQPALRRGAMPLVFPEGTVAGFGNKVVEKVGGLLAFTKIKIGDTERDVPVMFGSIDYDVTGYDGIMAFYNVAEPVYIKKEDDHLAKAVQDKIAGLSTLLVPRLLGGYVVGTGASRVSEAQAHTIVDRVITRVLGEAPHLAMDFNLVNAQTRAAQVTRTYKYLVDHDFIDGETGEVNLVGHIVQPGEKPLPLRDRPEKQHRLNPLGFGGNSIVQQANVVPELKAILSEVYLDVARVAAG